MTTPNEMSTAHEQTPDDDIEYALVEITAAVGVIQILVPDTIPDTQDQQALTAIGYIACRIVEHVRLAEKALERRADLPREPQS